MYTYRDARGLSLAEVVLVNVGQGWQLEGTQQCASEAAARVQEDATS